MALFEDAVEVRGAELCVRCVHKPELQQLANRRTALRKQMGNQLKLVQTDLQCTQAHARTLVDAHTPGREHELGELIGLLLRAGTVYLEEHKGEGFAFRITRKVHTASFGCATCDDADAGEDHVRVCACALTLLQDEKGEFRTRSYLTLSTLKAGVIFTNKALRQLCNDYRTVNDTYQKAQIDILREAIGVARTTTTAYSLFHSNIDRRCEQRDNESDECDVHRTARRAGA